MAEKDKLSSTQVIEEEWDKKKIAIAVVVVIFLIAGFIGVHSYVLPMLGFKQSFPQLHTKRVQGIQTSVQDNQTDASSTTETQPPQVSLPTANDVQQQVQNLQYQVTHLSFQEVASSSPQVQQILQQIESLPQAPANAAKQACIQLCNKL